MKDAIARFTTDNITNVAFGINTDSFSESNPLFRYYIAKHYLDKTLTKPNIFTENWGMKFPNQGK